MKKANWKKHKGKTARDRVTGFTGVITAHVEYLTGCDQYGLTPKAKEDSTSAPSTSYLDITKLDIIKDDGVIVVDDGDNGCDSNPPA